MWWPNPTDGWRVPNFRRAAAISGSSRCARGSDGGAARDPSWIGIRARARSKAATVVSNPRNPSSTAGGKSHSEYRRAIRCHIRWFEASISPLCLPIQTKRARGKSARNDGTRKLCEGDFSRSGRFGALRNPPRRKSCQRDRSGWPACHSSWPHSRSRRGSMKPR